MWNRHPYPYLARGSRTWSLWRLAYYRKIHRVKCGRKRPKTSQGHPKGEVPLIGGPRLLGASPRGQSKFPIRGRAPTWPLGVGGLYGGRRGRAYVTLRDLSEWGNPHMPTQSTDPDKAEALEGRPQGVVGRARDCQADAAQPGALVARPTGREGALRASRWCKTTPGCARESW